MFCKYSLGILPKLFKYTKMIYVIGKTKHLNLYG